MKTAQKKVKFPKGIRICCEDDIVAVYKPDGTITYKGMFDYCPYKNDASHWDDKDKNYKLDGGYVMVGIA